MPHLHNQHQRLQFEQLREVKTGQKTDTLLNSLANNGLDEVLLEVEGKTYLAVGESLDLAGLKGQAQTQLELNGETRQARVLGQQDDISSWSEGWAKGKSLGDSLQKAWQGMSSSPQWQNIHTVSQSISRWPQATVSSVPVEAPKPATPPVAENSPVKEPPISKPTIPPSVEQPATDEPATQAKPKVEVFFTRTPGQSPAHKLAEFIKSADKTVDIAAFELDSEVVRDAILEAHGKGRQVRVVTDSDYSHEPDLQAIKAAGVPVIEDQRSGLMHNKFVVIDQGTAKAAVWTGSMNFTDNCTERNDNNALIVRSPELAENYGLEFAEMFEHQQFGKTSPHVVPHPSVTVGHSKIETYFAAEGKVAGRVAEALNTAQKSIHFMTFSFTHEAIGEVVASKHAAKLTVQGVFDNTQAGSRYSRFHALKAEGAEVRRDGNPKVMHHKVFIIDEKTVLTGSFNFSQSADNSNDENMLIIEDPEIAKLYLQEFKRVYGEAKAE